MSKYWYLIGDIGGVADVVYTSANREHCIEERIQRGAVLRMQGYRNLRVLSEDAAISAVVGELIPELIPEEVQ